MANEQQPAPAAVPAQAAPMPTAVPLQAQPVSAGSAPAPAVAVDTRPVPSLGRVVHYRLAQGANIGAYRPALIVRVFDAEEGGSGATPESLVQLQVFTDQNNDELPALVWASSVRLGEGNGEYCWPPYVPPAPAPLPAVAAPAAKA